LSVLSLGQLLLENARRKRMEDGVGAGGWIKGWRWGIEGWRRRDGDGGLEKEGWGIEGWRRRDGE
jgi:hypothetical protein